MCSSHKKFFQHTNTFFISSCKVGFFFCFHWYISWKIYSDVACHICNNYLNPFYKVYNYLIHIQKLGNFWSILLSYFIKHKPIISEELPRPWSSSLLSISKIDHYCSTQGQEYSFSYWQENMKKFFFKWNHLREITNQL